MNQKKTHDVDQKIELKDTENSGQIGQAARDLIQVGQDYIQYIYNNTREGHWVKVAFALIALFLFLYGAGEVGIKLVQTFTPEINEEPITSPHERPISDEPEQNAEEAARRAQEKRRVSALLIESIGAQATAQVGDSRIDNYNRADIVFSVRQSETGTEVTSLAPRGHTGDSNSIISLPSGWSLDTKKVPPGGCTLKPTHIYNDGTGGYTLSVMTVARDRSCPWLRGEYIYQIRISVDGYGGSSVGKIAITTNNPR